MFIFARRGIPLKEIFEAADKGAIVSLLDGRLFNYLPADNHRISRLANSESPPRPFSIHEPYLCGIRPLHDRLCRYSAVPDCYPIGTCSGIENY